MRTYPVVGAVSLLSLLCLPLRADVDPLQVWTGSGGDARLELRAETLAGFGLEVAVDGQAAREDVETRRRLTPDDRLVIEAPAGNFERILSGHIVLDTGWTLRHRGREVRLDGLVLTPALYRNGHPSLEARDRAGRHLLTFSHLHIVAEHHRGSLIVHNADVEATAELAELLGLEALVELPFAMAWLDLYLDVPAGADTSGIGVDSSGRGLSCVGRPFWPQNGHEIDVALIWIGSISHQGTAGDGRIKVTPSATLKNVSEGDVPWVSKFTTLGSYPFDPADQHPFLVWNMYRIADGRIEQLGASGVKHAFLTLNTSCTINCGSSHVLWPGCEDVYGVGTNESGSHLGPRPEIEASVALWENCGSFFDPGCVGNQTNSSGTFQNRLLVDPSDLQTPGATYYLDAWYVIQYDIDIWNSMGYHQITPTPSGGGWNFGPLGPYTVGRVIDQWVDPDDPGSEADHAEVVIPSATPGDPYPGNMPQGHINVLVRVSEPEPGRYRYNYAVQNFDFERGVEAFRIPVGAGAQVFDTFFGDIDDDAGNDWTVSVDGGFVEFVAPTDNPLPWFTLFNFEIEVDTPPAAGQVTLDLGGDAVVPAIDVGILAPAGGGGKTHVVTVQNDEFVPADLTIDVGDTVEWNSIEGIHNVVADDDSFTSGPVAPAPWTFSFTFDSVGTNPYYCGAHGGPGGVGMAGVITVVGESAPELSFDPTSLDFGAVEVGETSPPQTATLHNTGDAAATGLAFGGLPDAGFEADTSACGATLEPAASCEVSVTFTPSEAGPATATLEATSAEDASASLAVEGNGLPGGTHLVIVQNFEFVPPELTINVGETVQWNNIQGFHNVVADDESFTSGPPASAPWTFTHTFDTAGAFPYYCAPHGGPGGDGMAAVITVLDTGVFSAAALAVDSSAIVSDGNGVFEPGESVEVAPAWRNGTAAAESAAGTASDFSGPPGATYSLVHDEAQYGSVEPGQTASCQDTGVCYQMGVNNPAVRPATHWDATFGETLSEDTSHTWALHLGDSFTDVPRTSGFYASVETLLHHGITGGCSGSEYCPAAKNTRAQMPAFVLRALEGADYAPPACVEGSEVFGDVPAGHPFCAWIEELANRGVVSGCGGGDYCPGNPVTRGQMAIFLLKTLEGSEYTPPACTGVFADVACPSTFADWIEELSNRGITGGCSSEPLRYCPANPVNRQQMAIFVSRTFGLTLYGP